MDILAPMIAPGQKLKIEIYNDGNDLITYVTYPDKAYSLCACSFYFTCIAAIIAGLYYYVKCRTGEPLTTPPEIPTSSQDSLVSSTSEISVDSSDTEQKKDDEPIAEVQKVASTTAADKDDLISSIQFFPVI